MNSALSREYWILPDFVFEAGTLLDQKALYVVDGLVKAVVDSSAVPRGAESRAIAATISPGFVDLQVNGGGGFMVNTDPNKDAIWAIAKAHRGFGTVAILPTVITDSQDVLPQAVDAVIGAFGKNGVWGIHIEGPHISAERRGTHKSEYIRPLDDNTLRQVAKLRDAGVPTMMTVAPEVVSPENIKMLTQMGVVVSLGHSAANSSEAQAAFHAGARCVTHLFNAMSPMVGREPGVTGAAINSEAYVGVICDGIHVSDEMIGLALRARPMPDRMYIVSDAMPTVGGPTSFDLYGTKVHLEANRLVNAEGSLAGAHTTQAKGVERLVSRVGLTPQDALKMAITIPSMAIGLELDRIVERNLNDLICLDKTMKFQGSLEDFILK